MTQCRTLRKFCSDTLNLFDGIYYLIWHSQKSTLYMQPCRFINSLTVWSIFLHYAIASTSNNQLQDIAPQGQRRDVSSEETSVYQQPSGESPLSWKRKITLFFVFKITTQTTTTTAGWQGPYSCGRASRRPTAPQDFPGKDVRAAKKQAGDQSIQSDLYGWTIHQLTNLQYLLRLGFYLQQPSLIHH